MKKIFFTLFICTMLCNVAYAAPTVLTRNTNYGTPIHQATGTVTYQNGFTCDIDMIMGTNVVSGYIHTYADSYASNLSLWVSSELHVYNSTFTCNQIMCTDQGKLVLHDACASLKSYYPDSGGVYCVDIRLNGENYLTYSGSRAVFNVSGNGKVILKDCMDTDTIGFSCGTAEVVLPL